MRSQHACVSAQSPSAVFAPRLSSPSSRGLEILSLGDMNLSLGLALLPYHPYSLSETILLQGWSLCKDTKRAHSVASIVSDSATPWTVAHQALPSVGFSRQGYWSGLAFPSPGEPGSPALHAGALPSEQLGKPPKKARIYSGEKTITSVSGKTGQLGKLDSYV